MAKGRRARVSDVVESATRASERLRWLDRPSYRLDTIVTWERTNHHHDHRRPLGTPTTIKFALLHSQLATAAWCSPRTA